MRRTVSVAIPVPMVSAISTSLAPFSMRNKVTTITREGETASWPSQEQSRAVDFLSHVDELLVAFVYCGSGILTASYTRS